MSDLAQRDLAQRVRAALADLHPNEPIGGLQPLVGGHSGLTYAVAAGPTRYAVKASVAAERPVGRNDMLRQARALRTLAGSGVPIPAIAVVDDADPPWFAMEYVEGDATEPVLDEHALPAFVVRTRMLDLAKVLRSLHEVDCGPLEAEPVDPGAELARWTRTMHAVPAELRPGGAELMERLGETAPAAVAPTLVHGDFRLGNALCQGSKVLAVIDWELWSVGDPRVDLAWFLLFADAANFPRLGSPSPGVPPDSELLGAYLGARPLPADFAWFRALSRAKMAAIMGHNLRRHREGRRHDPDQERLPPTIAAMLRSARAILDD